jgi:endonuclease/exonuclease/phosphatase (EEP) superfamily protein YafD
MARTRSRPSSRLAAAVSVLAIVPIIVLAAALLTASVFWPGDLLTFFMPWVAIAAMLTLVAALLFRLRLGVVAALGLCVVVAIPFFNAWSHVPAPVTGVPLRVTTFNTLVGTADPDALMAFLDAERPDILVLQEYSTRLETELADRFAAMFPYRSDAGESIVPTLLVLSRYPITATEVTETADPRGWPDQSLIRAEIAVGPQTIVVYAVHAPTPRWGEEAWQERNALLADIADQVAAEPNGTAMLVAGDFNTPPWSPFFLALLGNTALTDTTARLLPPATRFVRRSTLGDLLGAPVDHILASQGIGWRPNRVGPDLGSDHRPLTADLVLPP